MQIRILRNLGSGFPPYAEGDVVDADQSVAELLIKKQLAEPVLSAVAKEPELKAVRKDEPDSVSIPVSVQPTVSDAPAVKSKTSSKEK